MNLLIKLFLPVSLLTWLSVRYVDQAVALLVRDYLFGSRQWSRLTSSLPDALLLVVVAISLSAFISRLYRKRKLLLDAHTRFLGHIALSLPVSYGVRAVLKYAFGREITRAWILKPQFHEFHWFNGGAGYNGFPSGHMIVFATLFAAIARYHPGFKLPCYLLLGLLALLLVATNYHFVGDVIFGTYVGLLVEAGMEKVQPAGTC
ncbi:MAG TPA: phosphatase PAP2 family protein [Geobacteraceae bacterium]|nr:phosphatase PAP2 family protein [Geobacteraceae bacterium]